ncbi:MAG: hypothetical protein IKA65_04645 [Lentisphaeria bacterium]|nr:hypothetical protein [Lentisphaeria bacterium]
MTKVHRKKSAAPSGSRRSRKPRNNTALQATIYAIVFIIITLALLLVEFRPVKTIPAWGGAEESLASATAAGKVFAAFQTSNRKRNEICAITFSQAEANALLAAMLRNYESHRKTNDPQVYAKWQNGLCAVECSKKFAFIYLNFYLFIQPEIHNGKLDIQVHSPRLGKIPLPAQIVEKVLNTELSKHIAGDHRLSSGLGLIHILQAEKSGEIRIEFLRKKSGAIIRSLL